MEPHKKTHTQLAELIRAHWKAVGPMSEDKRDNCGHSWHGIFTDGDNTIECWVGYTKKGTPKTALLKWIGANEFDKHGYVRHSEVLVLLKIVRIRQTKTI